MMEWEYKVMKARDGVISFVAAFEDENHMLASLGQMGWELVTVVYTAPWHCYYFKRPHQDTVG